MMPQLLRQNILFDSGYSLSRTHNRILTNDSIHAVMKIHCEPETRENAHRVT